MAATRRVQCGKGCTADAAFTLLIARSGPTAAARRADGSPRPGIRRVCDDGRMSNEAARSAADPDSPDVSLHSGEGHGDTAVPAGAGSSAITELGHDVFQIDTRMAGYPGVTAAYLIRSERPCLVETGTGPSAPVVRDALAVLGIGPGDLATVVVTHIHLDHAGGAGDIAGMFPHADVVVHERGARHLVDPSRLMKSARMVYGDELDELFGGLAPTPVDRIRAVEETGTVDLGGGRRLDSHYSPGHAKHHVGLLDSVTGDLYVGDAAGVYIPETADLRPASPPPDFDLETALTSLRMFASLRPARLLFSHFGPVGAVDEVLARSAEELHVWVDEVSRAHGAGLNLDHVVAMVHERTKERYAVFGPDADADVAARFARGGGTASNVAGIMHWLDRSGAARA